MVLSNRKYIIRFLQGLSWINCTDWSIHANSYYICAGQAIDVFLAQDD